MIKQVPDFQNLIFVFATYYITNYKYLIIKLLCNIKNLIFLLFYP